MVKKRYKVDWFTVTDKFHDLSEVSSLWFQYFGEPVDFPGRYGYKSRFTAEGVSVLYDGGNRGICTDINGTGTNILYNQGFVLEDYIRSVVTVEPYYHITRLDVAMDYFADTEEDCFPFQKLIDCVNEGRFVSKVHKNGNSCTLVYGIDPGKKFHDPICTVTIGSKHSDIKLRIYNKLAEQKSKKCGYIPTDIFDDGEKEPLQWLRFEFELRSERAEQFAALLRKDTLQNNFDAVLSKFIRFVDDYNLANPQLSPVCDWWDNFVDKCANALFNVLELGTSFNRSHKLVERMYSRHALRNAAVTVCSVNKGCSGLDCRIIVPHRVSDIYRKIYPVAFADKADIFSFQLSGSSPAFTVDKIFSET